MYQSLNLQNNKDRAHIYINVVQTIDGKLQVKDKQNDYWPIGSQYDYEVLTELRAQSDVLIHGKNTAMWTRTVDNLGKESFLKQRKLLGKNSDILYVVISGHPDKDLAQVLDNIPAGVKGLLATTDNAVIPEEFQPTVEILRIGEHEVDLAKLSEHLYNNGYINQLVEGGSKLFAGYFKNNLIDEIFLTIAPKIFGENGTGLSMLDGYLFPPKKIESWRLLSSKQVGNEIFLRYARQANAS